MFLAVFEGFCKLRPKGPTDGLQNIHRCDEDKKWRSRKQPGEVIGDGIKGLRWTLEIDGLQKLECLKKLYMHAAAAKM